jgi:predicted nucleic acid-binding protein
LTKKDELTVTQNLNESLVFQSDLEITSLAIKIRLAYGLQVPDALVAASAIKYNMPLISADTDLSKVRELQLIQYVF